MKPKFEFMNWRERKTQKFDKSKITLTKAGKTYNVYDKIQEGREDTEIYPTLEKYGCIDRMILNSQGVYADFKNFKDLRDLKDQQNMATNMFYNLPLETRKEFNNNINTFLKEGEKWLKNKIEAEKPKVEQPKVEIEKPKIEINTNKGEVNNG